MLGDVQIPIFQPGSIMFNSAVKANSTRARFPQNNNLPNTDIEDGCKSHTNSLILSTRDAIFLAKFLGYLSKTYVALCEQASEVSSSTRAAGLNYESPQKCDSESIDSPSYEASSPDSIASPLRKQATKSSVLHRDSPDHFGLTAITENEAFRLDIYQQALTSVLEQFSQEDSLYYGR
jgi:hypothetical protein